MERNKKAKKKEIITTKNNTDNNNEILNLFKEKFQGFDREIQPDNDDKFSSRICGIDNFFIERKYVDAAICNLNEGIDPCNVHSKHLKESGNVF